MFEDVALLLTALGIGGVLTTAVQSIIQRITGKADREQNAWAQRDEEAAYRRVLQEALHDTREALRRQGVAYEDMPPWPSRPGRRTRSKVD